MAAYIGSGVTLKGLTHNDFHYTFNISGTVTASDIGKAVTQDADTANTVKLAGDGDEIIGRLEAYEDRTQEGLKLATVSLKGGLEFPVKSGETVAIGDSICGAGSGLVKALAAATLPQGEVALVVDITALGTAQTVYIPTPVAGVVTKVYGVSDGAGSTADATVTVSKGATALAALVFEDDYTAGTAITDATIADHELAAGDVLTVVTDGGGAGTGLTHIVIYVAPEAGVDAITHTTHDRANRVWATRTGYCTAVL